jgi:hypothetical protein
LGEIWFPSRSWAFWNFQASTPFIHMPYNISIKFHPIPSTLNCSCFSFCGFHDNGGHFENYVTSLHIYS